MPTGFVVREMTEPPEPILANPDTPAPAHKNNCLAAAISSKFFLRRLAPDRGENMIKISDDLGLSDHLDHLARHYIDDLARPGRNRAAVAPRLCGRALGGEVAEELPLL